MGARSSHPRSPNLNKTDGHLIEYFRNSFGAGGGGTNAERVGLEATGGNATSTYYDPDGFQYKAHIFTSSGSFVVDTPGDFDDEVDYLIIAGGGGGGSWVGGGGGAGGVISSHPDYPSAKRSSPQPVSSAGGPYAVVIGAGGVGWDIENGSATATGTNGVNSSVFSKVASGGGVGGGWSLAQRKAGGSGAGGAYPGDYAPGASGNLYPDAAPTPEPLRGQPAPNQGNPGGTGVPGNLSTGGGGGAGAAGGDAVTNTSGDGGEGVRIKIAGAPTYSGTGRGAPGPGGYMWYAGGGGGGHHNGGSGPVAGTGGRGGGGDGLRADAARASANSGLDGTGSGGGGNGGSNGNGHAGDGGDGIVIIRYRVG